MVRGEESGVRSQETVRREASGVRSEESAGVTPSRLTPHSSLAAGAPSRLTPHPSPAEGITCVSIPSLIRTDQREWRVVDWHPGITVQEVAGELIDSLRARGHDRLVIMLNGREITDRMPLHASPLTPGDFVSVSVEHGFDPIQAAIWVAMWHLGMYAAINTVSAVLATALVIGGGMLVSNLAGAVGAGGGKSSTVDSPTYGFNAVNATTSGNPVAVVHGNVRTCPQILNSYRRASDDYNMWIYVLLGLGAGETNHYPTAADVYLGDEPLANYTDYYFSITSGSVNPSAGDEAALSDKFSSIYHDRSFDRQMKYADLVLTAVAAQGTVTMITANPEGDDSITIGSETWVFKGVRSAAYEVAVDAVEGISGTLANFVAAVNADSSVVTASTVAFSEETGWYTVISAVTAGAAGNSLAFTADFETPANVSLDGSGYLGGTTVGKDATDPETVFHLDTRGEVDQVMLMVTFPYGKFYINDDGDFLDFQVDVAYGYRAAGSTGAITWDSATLTGKGTQAIRKELWITFPARGKYEIYLQRTTADDPENETKQRSVCYLTSLTEILDIFQVYPGIRCAVIGVKASENLSGQLSAIRVVENRTSITVPDWAGTGTMTVDPSNHAWSLYDALTNPHTGRRISPTRIIQERWEEWADWLDETVDGNRRSQLNMVFDAPGNLADNCLAYIEETGRCKVLRCGDYWSVAVDKPRPIPSYTFGRGNIIQGSWSWEGYEDAEKTDAIQISYYDKDRGWNRKSVIAKASWYESLAKEPLVSELQLLTCNNRDQATREAILRMQKTEAITRHGRLSALFRAAALEPLDRVDIVHATIPFGFSGCLAEDHEAAAEVTLDQSINLTAADYDGKAVLIVITNAGARVEFDITGPFDAETRTITIDGSLTAKRFDVWVIGRPSEDKLAYQIATKKLTASREVEFEVVEYNEAMFYNPAYGSGLVAI